MAWYRLKAYLNYRLKAQGRHGVHSPFVFDFIERGLRSNARQTLQDKIRAYFHDLPVIALPDAPQEWVIETPADRDTILQVGGIHRSARHTERWEILIAHPSVRLSIDLFDLGLLFFREEFKEKQHFVLKH